MALVSGGALGNLHDRIVYGSVIDFIEVHIFSYHWPDFNVADSSIVTGACLLLLDSLLPKKAPPRLEPFPLDHFAVPCAPSASAPHAVTGTRPFVTSYPSPKLRFGLK